MLKISDPCLKPIDVYTLNTGIELRKRNRPITEEKISDIKLSENLPGFKKETSKKQKTEES